MPVTGLITKPTRRRRTWVSRFVVAALGCLVFPGCAGQSSNSPAATPTASGPASTASATYSVQLCSEAAEYQMAANTMATIDATTAGSDAVEKAVLDLQTATDNLIAVAAAENQFGPQLAELEKASTSLDATIEGLPSQDNVPTNLGEITPSVTAVEQAAKPIINSLQSGCPSVPPAVTPPTS
jgi:hypothetical protein